MLPDASKFEFREVDGSLTIDGKTHYYKASKLFHAETGLQFGEYFQSACRSNAWKAAGIIINKYKRKMDLGFDELKELRSYLERFEADRITGGKKCAFDFLVQEASNYIKQNYEPRKTTPAADGW